MIYLIRIIQAVKQWLKGLQRYKIISVLLLVMVFYFTGSVAMKMDDNFEPLKVKVSNQAVIALTFDDGPHPGFSEKLVRILDSEGVKGTFFVVGKMVEKYPELVLKEFMSGHEIGNHTYSDTRITKMAEEKAEKEILKTGDLIRNITGKLPCLLRPPGGHYNGAIMELARKLEYKIILWTLNPNDIVSPPAGDIYSEVIQKAKNEDIVIFHDGIESTLEALPSIIKRLKEMGFRLVTVSELVQIKEERLYADSGD